MTVKRTDAHAATTAGERIADAVAAGMGCWKFIIIQTLVVIAWMLLNALGWFVWHWDPYPFILLNLLFSTQAAYAAPIIMMSQNRQAAKDRAMAERDDEELGLLVGASGRLEEMQQEQMTILHESRQHNDWTREHITAMERRLAALAPKPRSDNPHVDHALPEVARP